MSWGSTDTGLEGRFVFTIDSQGRDGGRWHSAEAMSSMESPHLAIARNARFPAFTAICVGLLAAKTASAGTRGEFDSPLAVTAVGVPSCTDAVADSMQVFEISIPVSFRVTKGQPSDIEELEIELTLADDQVQLLSYEPETTLAGDLVDDIEETVTTEESRNLDGGVSASFPVPGLIGLQAGPSANVATAHRTIRTQKIRRRPKMEPIVVAGTTSRGRGVYFQLRPAAHVTLQGAHTFKLIMAVPPDRRTSRVHVTARAWAREDWILFKRTGQIAKS